MFSADAELDARAGFVAFLNGNLHESAHACLVNRGKRIGLADFQFRIRRQKAAGVVAAQFLILTHEGSAGHSPGMAHRLRVSVKRGASKKQLPISISIILGLLFSLQSSCLLAAADQPLPLESQEGRSHAEAKNSTRNNVLPLGSRDVIYNPPSGWTNYAPAQSQLAAVRLQAYMFSTSHMVLHANAWASPNEEATMVLGVLQAGFLPLISELLSEERSGVSAAEKGGLVKKVNWVGNHKMSGIDGVVSDFVQTSGA